MDPLDALALQALWEHFRNLALGWVAFSIFGVGLMGLVRLSWSAYRQTSER